jgi:DNA polymerase V
MSIALVDCNNFYASCEAAFQPMLQDLPVIVLSNNDGCVVARSSQAKALGIPMGEPFFKVQHLVQKHNIQVFSSNYGLYGDMSARVMSTLAAFTPDFEPYSIDEVFLGFDGFNAVDLLEYGYQIRDTVKQWTGLPVSIGFAPTKTLAKIANHLAKDSGEGVVDITHHNLAAILSEIAIEEVWGIGRRWGRSLRAAGITTALQLQEAELGWIKRKYSVVLQRTVLELRGHACIPLELAPPTRKSIMVSRSFRRPVTELVELKEAIATYISRAAEKLRLYQLTANVLQVFARSSRFKEDYYSESVTLSLPNPTQDTRVLMLFALQGAEAVYRPDCDFNKAGVVLLELRSVAEEQLDLFAQRDAERSMLLMQTVDQINRQFGSGTIQFAVAGLQKSWGMRQEQRSNRWTTCWRELPVVRA